MITVQRTVTTTLDPRSTFDYLSAFEHTSEWDPGIPIVEKRSDGPVAALLDDRYPGVPFAGVLERRQVVERGPRVQGGGDGALHGDHEIDCTHTFCPEKRGEPRSTDDPTDSGFPPARWGVWAYSPGLRSPSE